MTVVFALSATFCTYFILGAMITWNRTPQDRSLVVGLFVIGAFALALPPSLFILVAKRAIDPDGTARGR